MKTREFRVILVPKEGVAINKKPFKYRMLRDKNSNSGFLKALNWVPKRPPAGPPEVGGQGSQSHTNNAILTAAYNLRGHEVA
jgi:hypothetical protein